MIERIRRHPWVAAAAVVVLGVGAWLVFGFFQFQTLFIDDKVDEARPVFKTGSTRPGRGRPARPPEPDELRGEFISRSHGTEGTALVLSGGGDERVLRFEDFETDNGPDLNVYLTSAPADADAGQLDDDFVDLGDLKGNIGNQNYEIPPDVDLDKYGTVVVWCVQFKVAFGAADLG